jgi:AcrR family transcriptional regulator
MKQDTKKGILEAASRVVQKSGVSRMTLEEVAAEAKVSKGGLLYHFRSKEALIRGLVDDLIEQCDHFFDSHHNDRSPGSFTRAYLESSLVLDASSAVGVVSAIANDPSLLKPLHGAYARWQARLENDGIDPVIATMVRLVADGLWFSFLIGAPSLDRNIVKRLVKQIEDLTRVKSTKRGGRQAQGR